MLNLPIFFRKNKKNIFSIPLPNANQIFLYLSAYPRRLGIMVIHQRRKQQQFPAFGV
jgi:hypothetical protein